MTTNYDPIAELYQRSKQQPWRAYVEAYTLMGLLGELERKSVLDVACGEGFYTRMLRRRGAARVVGVDLSPAMIALARAQEEAKPLGIDYVVADGKDLRFDEPFDLVFAAYFLNYAHDVQELQAMCASLARCLKPGGGFVTVNCDPAGFAPERSYRKYGFEGQVSRPLRNGAPITLTFFLENGGTFEIENYFLDRATHEAALRAAGFSRIGWPTPRLSPEGRDALGGSFWEDFMDHPPMLFIDCVK
jgi:SAM-dependent methyltransferase